LSLPLAGIGQDLIVRRVLVSVLTMMLLGACSSGGSSSATDNTLPDDVTGSRCPSVPPSVSVSKPSTLPALVQLSSREGTALHGALPASGHGHAGAEPPIDLDQTTKGTLTNQLRAAALVACQLRTPEEAQRAGYVRSANFDQGTGTHYTNWGLVDAPFDPTRPSMLLYGPRLGETQLVGFSYWVRTSEPSGPAGFSGSADHWHRHYGMCFDGAGLLQREDVRSPRLCAGTYLNGDDMWMLHAWVVPGSPNAWGMFAALNPQLCSRLVADLARCPGLEGP
jgi:hypothetical protein